ncbi:MAG: ABC transporter ATP-binding protein [Clostridia bacterium]
MLKKSVFGTLARHWLWCVALVVVVFAVTILALAPSYVLKGIVDEVLLVGQASSSQKLLAYACIYLAVLACIGIFDVLKQTLLVLIGNNITGDIRKILARKLQTVGAQYFADNDNGQLTSLFVNDVNTINTIFEEGLVGMAIDMLKIVGVVISMFVFSPLFGGITLLVIPIICVISYVFKKKMFAAQLQNRILLGKANSHIAQTMRAKQMLKAYALEDYMSGKYYDTLSENYKAIKKADFYGSIYSPIVRTFSAIVVAVIVTVAGVNLDIFGITIGMLAGGITLIESLFTPIDNLGMELQTLQSAFAGVKRLNGFLNAQDDPPKSELTLEEILPNKNVEIKFDNLSFGYDENVKVLDGLTVQINKGERVTFVGRTGVGKSTLFRLILGMIAGQGKITLNGVDVFSIKNELKPYIFGYVEQSFRPISGSIKDNITLGNDKLTDKNVQDALEFVLLGETIATLPKGIETEFATNLFSQGQLQLLSIARAIIYNPPILLLDEITANLDSVTEKTILEILQKTGENRTILAISHRESSIIKSDKIIYLQNGKIKNIKYND